MSCPRGLLCGWKARPALLWGTLEMRTMPRRQRPIDRARQAVRVGNYDLTRHAVEEMAEDTLSILDVEEALLNGEVARTERGDPRGNRYVLQGVAVDGVTPVGVAGRFVVSGAFLVLTVYEIS